MTWVVLAVGTAIFYALHGAWSKRLASRVSRLVTAWGIFAFSLPVFLLYLTFQGVPTLGPRFWPALAASATLNVGAVYLFVAALRAGELSLTYPLLALTPLLLVPVEWVLLGVAPGLTGMQGILLMIAGVYLLNAPDLRAGLLAPFAVLARDPGARRTLLVAALWSLTAAIDRVAVLESSPGFYGVALAATMSLLFLPLITIAGKSVPGEIRRAGLPAFLLHGLLFGAMFVLQMEALRLALAAYVISFKRSGALLGVVLGWLIFREGAVRHRLIGTAVILAGAILIVLAHD